MKRIFSSVFTFFVSIHVANAQSGISKPPITNETHKTWETLRRYGISADGKYVWYEYGAQEEGSTLSVVSSDGKIRKQFPGAGGAMFTADSRYILFNIPDRGICMLDQQGNLNIIEGKDFQVPPKGNGQWLAYKKDKDILLKNLRDGTERQYKNAGGCWFNKDGSLLILRKSDGLSLIALPNRKERYFYHGKVPWNVAFDKSGKQMAFITGERNELILRYYGAGMDTATILVTRHSAGIAENHAIDNMITEFSNDGKLIFFRLKKKDNKFNTRKNETSDVVSEAINVWSYRDKYLQSQQSDDRALTNKERFMAVVSVSNGRISILEDSTTELYSFFSTPNNRYVLANSISNAPETYWDSTQQTRYYLLPLRDSTSKRLLPIQGQLSDFSFSPSERFIAWCDLSSCYIYDIISGCTTDLTAQIPYRLDREGMFKDASSFTLGGWISSDKGLLIYDRYDIWQIDPLGKRMPINITGGYGKNTKTVLRRAFQSNLPVEIKDSLVLTGLEDRTGDNGFFKVKLSTEGVPRKCEMGAYLYYFPGVFVSEPSPPVKAAGAEVYIMTKQSVGVAPNLVLTRDFKTFTPLSAIAPQKTYNWMTAERIWWKAYDGKERAGILYKPENFDATKKYPVIFTYYELRSNELHQFKSPAVSVDNLNISWYVSHGYIVFVADIWPMKGHTGKSALMSVESAADYLITTYPWVNAAKLGLQGHSFGGFETNYIITHSTRFAAAQSAAGFSNATSCFGQIAFGGKSLAHYCEEAQLNLGGPLWERPDIYIENSPVFLADKVTTPLLLMHNKEDGAVPFSQGLEFFNALRRLQKSVWMLQYDGEGHNLFGASNALDYTIRTEQFFDHYLKDVPPPLWMTQSIPLKDKGIRSGLALDASGRCSDKCPVCSSSTTKSKTTLEADQNYYAPAGLLYNK